MPRLNEQNTALAAEIIARYPRPKSALIPLLHLAQEQDGWVTDEAMRHIADLVGVTPAEVRGTGTFYEMFQFEPIGRYLINICGTMSCALLGADELMRAAEEELGIHAGGTTDDGMFTLHRAECQAACTEAPCLQVNYRYRFRVTPVEIRQFIREIRAGQHEAEIPSHGTLARIRQHIPVDRGVGAVDPADVNEAPVWVTTAPEGGAS